ncbi:hypothetical protein D3C79_807310 [compost metagenome]
MTGLFVEGQGKAQVTGDQRRQPTILLCSVTGQVQQRAAEHHAGQQRCRRQVAANGFEDRPQAHAAEIQATQVLGERNGAPSQRHRIAPQLRVETLATALVTQAALGGNRATSGQKVARAVGQQSLFVAVDQVHGVTPFLASGRPSTRLAITLSCTSDAPPEMVRA